MNSREAHEASCLSYPPPVLATASGPHVTFFLPRTLLLSAA